jgi:hypothetical protein
MKKFKCTVTRTDEYEIEIDDKVLNKEWMKNFRSTFYPFDTYAEHAEQIAQMRARSDSSFIEGYGTPLVNHKIPFGAEKNSIERAININVLSEDDDCDVEVEEI